MIMKKYFHFSFSSITLMNSEEEKEMLEEFLFLFISESAEEEKKNGYNKDS